jgi:hypothetical protein
MLFINVADRGKHSSLFCKSINDEMKKGFMKLAPGHGKEKEDKVPDLIDLTLKKKKFKI